MSCCDKDKHCHPYPIEPAPFAPGGCDPHPPRPPRPPRPPFKPGCPPSQYIGSRYVPIFAEPIEWDKSKAYESLTIVVYEGESYTSRCNVAPGIDITNTQYWAKTGAYNAILEQYRKEVGDLSSQVTGFASDNKEFREKIDGYDKDNAEMKQTVADTVKRVDGLADRVDAAEADIDALQATTAQHTQEIADLTTKDADLQRQISSNDTDIANIQDKNAEQDSRLDAIEAVNAKQETAIAKNASDIAAEVKRASAAEVENGKLIARNAEELAKHATELADHEKRITTLEADNVTNKADIRANAAKNTAQDAEIAAAKDAAAHAQETADSAEAKANTNAANIGAWTENHPGKTISQAVTDANASIVSNTTQITSVKNGLSTTNENVTNLQNTKADKTDLDAYVKTTVYTAGQKAQDDQITALHNGLIGHTNEINQLKSGKVDKTTYDADQQAQNLHHIAIMLPSEVTTATPLWCSGAWATHQNPSTANDANILTGFCPLSDGNYTASSSQLNLYVIQTDGTTYATMDTSSRDFNVSHGIITMDVQDILRDVEKTRAVIWQYWTDAVQTKT